MNQYAAEQIAVAATLTQTRTRTRRWKLIAGLVVVAAVAHQFSASVSLPTPLKRGLADVQRAVQPASPAAKSEPAQPTQPATSAQPTAEDRRREAAAAARARRRYEVEVRRMQPPPAPQPARRVTQPERVIPQPPPQSERGVGLATVFMTAAQAARVAEQIERGRFSPSRELDRAARRMEREERRRQRLW